MEKITRPWRHYADFSGRSTRTEFWLFYILFYVLLGLLFFVPVMVAGFNPIDDAGSEPSGAIWLAFVPVGLFVLASIIPGLAVTVRRLHDSNKSGWMYLLTCIPYAGFLFFIVFGFLPGTPGENDYGFNPRYDEHMQAASAQEIFG